MVSRGSRFGPAGFAGGAIALAIAIAVSGCARIAQPEPAPRPVTVKIPVAIPIYCQVPALEPPPLAIAMLTPDSAPADTIRAYVATVDVLKSSVRERDTILKGCGEPPDTAAAGTEQAGGPGVAPPPAAETAGSVAPPSARPLRSKEGGQGQGQKEGGTSFASALLGELRGLIPW
jgi:hypothetical protein